MKSISTLFSIVLLAALAFASCTKDNYDAPESYISGRVVYQGKPLQLRGNEAVKLQLYQRGYEKHDPVDVFVNQDGGFSVNIFDGQYQLITKQGNGPWTSTGRDTIEVKLNGRTEIDVEVEPYYLVENAQVALNGNKISAKFDVNKIAGHGIDRVFVMLGTTKFLSDAEHNVDRYDVDNGGDRLAEYDETGKTFTFDEKDFAGHKMFETAMKRETLYARIGLWPAGSDQAIYSEVICLK